MASFSSLFFSYKLRRRQPHRSQTRCHLHHQTNLTQGLMCRGEGGSTSQSQSSEATGDSAVLTRKSSETFPTVVYSTVKGLKIGESHARMRRVNGFRFANWFQRSHSTGHSLVQAGESHERFTLRLPEEVRNRLVNSTLSRTRSSGVTFTREKQWEKELQDEERRLAVLLGGAMSGLTAGPVGFSWTPPFVGRGRFDQVAEGFEGVNKAMDGRGRTIFGSPICRQGG
ncbi:hypothetical protein SESBI_11421 [Sesbania bispinosa]|nr:hypothetical protein SESBI_11421 [Sesbania bispinosa]